MVSSALTDEMRMFASSVNSMLLPIVINGEDFSAGMIVYKDFTDIFSSEEPLMVSPLFVLKSPSNNGDSEFISLIGSSLFMFSDFAILNVLSLLYDSMFMFSDGNMNTPFPEIMNFRMFSISFSENSFKPQR